jgi:Tol biopolymer transport system component
MTPERWRQIEDLYNLARNRGSEALANADADVRQEVLAMLAQESGGGILDQPAFELMASATRTLVIAGSKLGPYRIEAALGRGGMGEVFRATDTRLGREVAIKVSQEKFTDRFEREARAIAALNHPNICTLHDIGPDYLVMELLEGETLAARLKRGRLPMEQAIQYGAQIASALSAAHAKGIVHRDLKPGNVMVTKAGVKVLDFGLAKSTQDETLTAANAVMGTPAYMAPEQRDGKACDARTDIYALGLVISEMATGSRAQQGGRPPLDSLLGKLAHVVKACLAEDPDDRFQSAQDVKLGLEWIRDVGPGPAELASAAPAAHWRRALPWALFGITAAGFTVLALLHETGVKSTVRAEPVRLQIALPQKPPLQLTRALALSPDGRQLAFGASGADGIPRIYLRAMDSLEMRPLPGTESVGSLLFWKPDGRLIAFDSGGKLRKIAISGGPAEMVCSLNLTGIGGTWNADGDILFGQFGGPIMRVSAAGGVATPVTALDKSHGDVAHTEPHFLPDGRHFIYTRDSSTHIAISAGSLDVKPEEQDSSRFVQANLGGAYAPSSDPGFGQLLFLRGQTLMAQPFDAGHLKISGDAVRVVQEPLAEYWDTGTFSVSANGTLVYWSPGNVESRLTWFDAQGNVQGTVGSPAPYVNVALSPDGTEALMSKAEADLSLSPWMVDMSRGTSTRFELGGSADAESAVWAPSGGRSIIFSSARPGQMEDIYEKQVGGAGDPQELFRSNEAKRALSWSPDRRFLLYLSIGGERKFKLWVLPLQGDRKPLPLLGTKFDEIDSRFSPDGQWVAYVSNESGRYEVYVRPFPPDPLPQGISNTGVERLISDNGGTSPMWRPDGKELYYIDLDGKLMAAKISAGSAFQAGVPKFLFRAPPRGAQKPGMTRWAPSPDGKRFLFLVPENQEVAPFTVVLNWQAGLKK